MKNKEKICLGKKKRISVTLQKKAEIIKEIENGAAQTVIANRESISTSTISSWWANKEKILHGFLSLPRKNKKMRTANNSEIDQALFEWFESMREKKIPINGPILKAQAEKIAADLNYNDFICSTGWIDRFKSRHSLSYFKVSGESAIVDQDVVNNWINTEWQAIRQKYSTKDIFNADETGLFYKCLPNKTFSYKNEACTGGKISKERITLLLCSSMEGEKRNPLIIGKYKMPRCFKNKNISMFNYYFNTKAWMTRDIFTQELSIWDTELRSKNRKILLLLDNAASHPQLTEKLTNIEILFFPSNSTSVIQPMDQGIIQSFKIHYKKSLIASYIHALNTGDILSITLYDALKFIDSAWTKVTKSTIINCFRHAGLRTDGEKTLNSELDITKKEIKATGLFESQESMQEFLDIDNEIKTSFEHVDSVRIEENEKEETKMRNKTEPQEIDIDPAFNLNVSFDSYKKLLSNLYKKNFYNSLDLKKSMILLGENLETEIIESGKKQKKLSDYGFRVG